jgi:threonylcarbamoyladenosine tRNA methylthiotransferase MtaB
VAQAHEIARKGVKEIVLTGVNTGDFGRTTGERFIDLLRALDGVDGIERYRISSIEPNLLTDEIIDFCAASSKFQSHFHIPLQSGSNRILGLMRRRYTAEKFADRIARVREVMPDTFFGIDVIVGFPGETDEDFDETYRFLESIRPSQLHVFPYSVRPGTPAADMPDRVPPKTAAARAARLGELSTRLHEEFTAKFAGTHAEVLWEAEQKDGMMSGFTGNYIRVGRPHDPALVNRITGIVL